MTAPTTGQRAAWRDLANELREYAEDAYDRDASAAILTLLDALDAAEAKVARVEVRVASWTDPTWSGRIASAPYVRAIRNALNADA